jgi:hypothetical protein
MSRNSRKSIRESSSELVHIKKIGSSGTHE